MRSLKVSMRKSVGNEKESECLHKDIAVISHICVEDLPLGCFKLLGHHSCLHKDIVVISHICVEDLPLG